MDSELEKMKSEGKSEEEIDEYINEMVRQARRVEQHAEDCDLWAYRLFCDLSKDLDDSRRASLKRLEQRLTRRGHQYGNFLDRAIAVASSRWRGGHQPDHKRKSWNTTVSIIKSLALRSGTQQIHSERTQMMELGYVKYIQQPHPQHHSKSNSTSSSSTTQSASPVTQSHNHRPTWSYPPPEIFMSSTPCKSLINKPTTGPLEPQERKYISRIRGLFDDEEVKRWCTRVKKHDLERRVTIPKGLLSSPKGQGHEGKMGLAIATFTCSMCRDFVRWKEPPPTPSRQPGQNGGGGVSRHYTLGTESSLARSSVPSGLVSKLDDPTGLVLFGWEEVKNHLVCVERPVELKNRIKNGSRIGVGPGRCGHGMEQPTLTNRRLDVLRIRIRMRLRLG
ncbi:hypothetical protein BDN72DRAFT_125265 [Pluteus cervinus]|uniref:Uncharacterized protein n=1 Tax=Pluteus cervinus TaxID=181527 RepID=A0ACD3AN87_9AGAR|nr:hypothetical protein BDN72DRAFT_125265 [Pluteus cervinus]